MLCFNDDIQGTAAVALAGVLASGRITGTDFSGLWTLFLGAGSAATGIADLVRTALVKSGLSEGAARERLWFVDEAGLLVRGRTGLAQHNQPYAHAMPGASFTETIRRFRPHVLIGATGAPGTFNEEVVRLMAEINPRPVLFALSNPTSRAECSAEQVIRWSDGRAVFASGSPFTAVAFQGREDRPGQGNNAYVFPGTGLGAIACGVRTISDEIFLTAAHTLAGMVSPEDLASGAVYQPLTDIRKVSLAIAAAVAEQAWEQGLVRDDRPDDPESLLAGMMYDPVY